MRRDGVAPVGGQLEGSYTASCGGFKNHGVTREIILLDPVSVAIDLEATHDQALAIIRVGNIIVQDITGKGDILIDVFRVVDDLDNVIGAGDGDGDVMSVGLVAVGGSYGVGQDQCLARRQEVESLGPRVEGPVDLSFRLS